MAQISQTERFPGSGDDIARPALKRDESSYSRRRRKSSSLPGDPRGDTGGASLSTYSDNPPPEGPKTSFLVCSWPEICSAIVRRLSTPSSIANTSSGKAHSF